MLHDTIHEPADLLELHVTAVGIIIPAAHNADEDFDVWMTSAVVFLGSNSTKNWPMMKGPMVAPNDHIACAACKTGSL